MKLYADTSLLYTRRRCPSFLLLVIAILASASSIVDLLSTENHPIPPYDEGESIPILSNTSGHHLPE